MKSNAVPTTLVGRPFTTREAVAAGVTRRALSGPGFSRVHRGVYVVRGTQLDLAQRIAAAQLALPQDAHLSHITRIQQLGLDSGPGSPLHFTVARDLHVVPQGVFLHRTKVLPPVSEAGVSPAAAFIGVAQRRTLLDLIVIGDWLLNNGHMSLEELAVLAHRDAWRPGASQVLQVAPHLDGRAASPPESRMRAYVVFAGLPRPSVNVPLFDDPNSPILDLYFRDCRLALEYEGGHHFRDPEQLKRDIWRYGLIRGHDVEYLQVYDEMLTYPIAFVRQVFGLLEERGYTGPRPEFGRRWHSLSRPVPSRPIKSLT